MEDPERKWDHLTPETKYKLSTTIKFWKVKAVFGKLKALFVRKVN